MLRNPPAKIKIKIKINIKMHCYGDAVAKTLH